MSIYKNKIKEVEKQFFYQFTTLTLISLQLIWFVSTNFVFIVISYCQFFIFIHSCRPCYFSHPITVSLGCKLLAYHILCIYCKEMISLHGQLFCLFQVCGNASFGIPFLFCVCHYTYNFFLFLLLTDLVVLVNPYPHLCCTSFIGLQAVSTIWSCSVTLCY